MKCPHCKNRLLQKSGVETRVRTEGPITFDSLGVARAKCYWCKSMVELPLEMKKSVEVHEERLVIRRP